MDDSKRKIWSLRAPGYGCGFALLFALNPPKQTQEIAVEPQDRIAVGKKTKQLSVWATVCFVTTLRLKQQTALFTGCPCGLHASLRRRELPPREDKLCLNVRVPSSHVRRKSGEGCAFKETEAPVLFRLAWHRGGVVSPTKATQCFFFIPRKPIGFCCYTSICPGWTLGVSCAQLSSVHPDKSLKVRNKTSGLSQNNPLTDSLPHYQSLSVIKTIS